MRWRWGVVGGGGGWLSLGAWEGAGGGVAGVLAARGVGPESVVGVVAERSVGLVVAVLGVLKAGAAYLPVDAGYPAQRAGLMLADAGAAVVVTDRACAGVVPAGGPPRVVLEDVRSGLAGGGAGAAVSVLPGHAAYVMYTSGSTGRPKGVVVTHRGLACYVASVAGRAGLGEPGGRYGLLQPAGTDFGNTMMFTSLVTGGVLHVAGPGVAGDAVGVAGLVARCGIDYL